MKEVLFGKNHLKRKIIPTLAMISSLKFLRCPGVSMMPDSDVGTLWHDQIIITCLAIALVKLSASLQPYVNFSRCEVWF